MLELKKKILFAVAAFVALTSTASYAASYTYRIPAAGIQGGTLVSGSPAFTSSAVITAAAGSSGFADATFTNTTGFPLILDYYPSAPQAPMFTPTPLGNCPGVGAVLAPGASCTLRVTFAPPNGTLPGTYSSETGGYSSAYWVWRYQACALGSCSDPTPSGHTAQTTLSGVVPNVSTANLSFSIEGVNVGTNYSAGSYAVGTSKVITVTNTGSQTANLFGITGPSGNWGYGSNSTTCGGTLAGGASCTVTINLTPPGGAAPGTSFPATMEISAQSTDYSDASKTLNITYTKP